MSLYRLISSAGLDMGVFEGETEAEALDAMARDAGYRDQAEASEVAGPWDGRVIPVPTLGARFRRGRDRTGQLQIRLTADERDQLALAADRAGTTVSAYVRALLFG